MEQLKQAVSSMGVSPIFLPVKYQIWARRPCYNKINLMKSTVDEIRKRFDNEVERFSVLETGQVATMDAPLVLDLIATAAAGATPSARRMLDIGCGAGNYTLKLLQRMPGLDVTLIDLSRPMLERAQQRISAVSKAKIELLQTDIREAELGEGRFDIIVAAAVLHHLRGDEEWRSVFRKLHRALSPGGSLWISDMVEHTFPAVQADMKTRWGKYLAGLKGDEYRRTVFEYIEKEDTPRSFMFQVDTMREAGFREIELLHKNAIFAAFGGMK